MGFYTLFLIPFLFGLIGFIEPCSLAANIVFLNRINQYDKAKRMREAFIFTFVRGFFLALVGLSAAFIGSKFIKIQSSLFVGLGAFFILLGIITIINMYKPIFKQDINLGKFFKDKGTVTLGIIFGLVIPACAIGFVLALVGRAIIVGNLFQGFVSLFIFGIALSSPLIVFSYYEKSNAFIQRLYAKTKKIKWLGGAILIIVGILTILSSVWWAGALA